MYHTVTMSNFPQRCGGKICKRMILEYQVPLRYQFPLAFSEKFENYCLSRIFNFQNPIQKVILKFAISIDSIYNLPQKVARNDNKCECSQNISSLAAIFVLLYFKCLKNLGTSAEVKLINFQNATLKGDLNKYSGRAVFLLPENQWETNLWRCHIRYYPIFSHDGVFLQNFVVRGGF